MPPRNPNFQERASRVKELRDQFEITAQPQSAALARERVKRGAISCGFAGQSLDDIEVAVGEAATNAILYGSPTASSRIVITHGCTTADAAFFVEIRDQGHGFDPNAVHTDDNALGGRGLRLMRALMDRVELHYDGHGMTVLLIKHLPAP